LKKCPTFWHIILFNLFGGIKKQKTNPFCFEFFNLIRQMLTKISHFSKKIKDASLGRPLASIAPL